jgi:outer membrane protein OmpA-like peptidoglycan-associated protein
MRKIASCNVFGAALLASTLLAGTALAQSNPTAEQIINSLKPTGSVSDTTRGIRPLSQGSGMMSGPGMTMAPASSGIVARGPAPSTNLDIEFASGSATLTPEATAELDQLGKALTSPTLAAYKFKIIGHTDTTGDAATNQTLSQQRADAVKSYLETKFGVSDARLTTLGVGENDLLVSTPPQTPELRNRRVQIVNLGQ